MATLSSIDGQSKQPHVMLNSGAVMPRIGLGTWRSPNGEVEAAVYEAIKCGYRHIDCARVYGNEAEVGRGIARALKEGLCKREELFVTSKIWNNAHAPEHTRANLAATLQDLQLEYIDLWLIHWPNTFTWGKDGSEIFPRNEKGHIILDDGKESGASIKACWQTMETAVDEKKVRSIGVSNFVQSEIDDLLAYARIKPTVNQIEIHPYFPQNDMIEYCKSKDIVIEAYSPLGNLRNPGEEDVTPMNEAVVAEIGKKHNKTPGQVVLRWGLQHSGVILPKSTNAQRIKENFDIINDFELDAEDMAKMDELGKKNKRFLNPNFRENGGPVFKTA